MSALSQGGAKPQKLLCQPRNGSAEERTQSILKKSKSQSSAQRVVTALWEHFAGFFLVGRLARSFVLFLAPPIELRKWGASSHRGFTADGNSLVQSKSSLTEGSLHDSASE